MDGYQPTKSMAKHKDRPDSQRTTGGEESDAKPPNGIPVERPEPNSVRVRRQIAGKQPYNAEGSKDPAIGAILRIPGLRFPPLKSATPDNRNVATVSAIRAE